MVCIGKRIVESMSLTSIGSGKLSAMTWYFRRLQNMSLAEIPHRIRELFLRQVGRSSFVIRRDKRLSKALSQEVLPALPLHLDEFKRKLSAAATISRASKANGAQPTRGSSRQFSRADDARLVAVFGHQSASIVIEVSAIPAVVPNC